MPRLDKAKAKLDLILRKSRIHFYKPIQIAEILFRHRKKLADFKFSDVEFYRTHSKGWRDQVSGVLVGRVCNSSAKFQDDVFNETACPPWAIEELGKFNESAKKKGIVEAYVYKSMQKKMGDVSTAFKCLEEKQLDFDIEEFIALFERKPGLKRSVDKVYEITVHALFETVVSLLNVRMTLKYDDDNLDAVRDFAKFIRVVLGLEQDVTEFSMPARLYRVGVTNAADRGLDMFSNFGIAVQIKHLALNEELAEDITETITADKIVIVCKEAEQSMITAILSQVGWGERIQGIITFDDLKEWYGILLRNKKYGKETADKLLANLMRDFKEEFPFTGQIDSFLDERGYDAIALPSDWQVE